MVTWFIADQAGLSVERLRDVDLGAWSLQWWLLVTSCIALLGGYVGTGLLWGHIVKGLGGPTLPAPTSVRLFMVANLGRYVPGKVWQIAGLVALSKGRGIPGSTATAAAVLGQGIGLASATLIGLGSLWGVADGASWRWSLLVVLIALPAGALAPPVFRAVVYGWFRLTRADPPEELHPRRAATWFALGFANWVTYALAFWVLVLGLGFDASLLPTASAFAAAYVLGYLAIFAPAGLGVREGFLLALMAPQIGAGPAGAVAVTARLWTTIVEVVPAAAFWARHVSTSAPGAPTHE